MADAHAVLSASSSKMWIACPPAARLNAAAADISSEYAQQGSSAHQLAEFKVKHSLGFNVQDPTESLTYFDNEMADCTDSYALYVTEQIEKAKQHCKDPIVLIEQRVDFSKWVPGGFGTADAIIVSDDVLTIIDLKYGLGVLVDAEKNSQMMCYALGALQLFDGIYDIEKVSMTIFQPRREHISTYEISKKELFDWVDTILKPAAQLASKGEGEFKAGEHCRFCKVKAVCRKRAEYNLELAQYDFKMPYTLEDDEIEIILSKVDDLISWGTDIKEYALQQALNGKEWKDWKVVEGRSNRKYTDETLVADTVKNAGFDPYEHKVLGITAMTKLLGKAKFENLLSGFVEKPKGKPTLVPMSDKRPSMNKAAYAAEDFKEEI